MQRAVFALILLVCLVEYLGDIGWLPRSAAYLLELFAIAFMLYVLGEGAKSRFQNVAAQYWMLFGAIVLVMICGVAVNPVDAGPTFAGIRNYFRTLPFFFIGAVYAFSDKQIRQQLMLLAAICMLQVPIAIQQRVSWIARGGITGDTTMGTLQGSSYLSIFLICAMSVLIALQRRGFLSMKAMLILFVIFVIPTTINETRATFFMLPLTLLVTGVVLAKPGQRLKNILVTLFIIGMFGAIFVPIYDQLILRRPYGATMFDFMTSEQRAEGYFDRGTQIGAVGGGEAGRLEMITVPVSYLAREPINLLFGFGIGSASDSALGSQFSGTYYALFKPFLAMTFARVVLEIGLLGVALMLLLLWKIFTDCRVVAARDPGLIGALAAGWSGVVFLYVITFFYKDVVMAQALTTLFWLFSGIICAHRLRLQRRQRAGPAGERSAGAHVPTR